MIPGGVRVVKVAVIGSGLAGLTSAYLLSTTVDDTRTRFEVHLFEKDSVELRVDVPMRSFQGGYYPFLLALYTHLGVAFRTANFSYSFSNLHPTSSTDNSLSLQPWFLYNGRSALGGISVPSRRRARAPIQSQMNYCVVMLQFLSITLPFLFLFALSALLYLFNFIRLAILSCPIFYSKDSTETFGDWALRTTPRGPLTRWTKADIAWLEFIRSIVRPLFSALCTAAEEDIYQHPAPEILEYIWRTHFTNHYVVTNGVRDAIARLVGPLEPQNIHLSSTITSICDDPRNPGTAKIIFEESSHSSEVPSTRSISGFDHIVFATQANSASRILGAYRSTLPPKSLRRRVVDAQMECLNTFKYVPNTVINHTDDRFIPSHPSDQRDLNLASAASPVSQYFPRSVKSNSSADLSCVPPSCTMATHIVYKSDTHRMGETHRSSWTGIYQTTNPIIPPHKSTILSIARLERAVLTPRSKLAQRSLMIEEYESLFHWSGCSVHLPILGIKFNVRDWPFFFSRKRRRRLGRLQGVGKLHAQNEDDTAQSRGRSEAVFGGGDDATTFSGIWFCGSYAHPGIPLLEACVTSALNVVENGIFRAEGVNGRIDWLP
ncbi:uncharacterized protein EI90DRAFT_3041067 [Cantharellus anzutake]|uniref:uncharacterized protein n=1 Tax=Cantharellus anzutake TaxID=1750568 RepID=UPI0019053F9D|nr:uncharacterized protein EI90DRAFT_3041067 [Cantharellus anzutake]KAF8337931.1 hypothetical protein EI90DRAFT_3041067 [Cantharellus anzutake]